MTVKPARNQQTVVTPVRVALKVPTIVAVAVALTLFFVLATSVFSARHAAYAESVSNVTYETIRVQPGDSLWSLAEEYPIEGLSTQETSDTIRNVNHLGMVRSPPVRILRFLLVRNHYRAAHGTLVIV